jgi:hypothetical protein
MPCELRSAHASYPHTHLCMCRAPQKQLATERIGSLLEDRRIREQEEEVHRRNTAQQLEVSADKLRKAEEQLRQTTKDYILGERGGWWGKGAERAAWVCCSFSAFV